MIWILRRARLARHTRCTKFFILAMRRCFLFLGQPKSKSLSGFMVSIAPHSDGLFFMEDGVLFLFGGLFGGVSCRIFFHEVAFGIFAIRNLLKIVCF